MDLYRDFKALAKTHNMSLGQAVFRLAMIRRYREGSNLRVYPAGKYPRSTNYIAFISAFPCCACGTEERRYKNGRNIVAVKVRDGVVGVEEGSDYSAVPMCRKCMKDPIGLALVRGHHCVIQNTLFEAYIRASEGT